MAIQMSNPDPSRDPRIDAPFNSNGSPNGGKFVPYSERSDAYNPPATLLLVLVRLFFLPTILCDAILPFDWIASYIRPILQWIWAFIYVAIAWKIAVYLWFVIFGA